MKIMILGHGSVGSVLCEMFSKDKEISSIVCVERSITHFKNKGKIHFKEADLSNKKELSRIVKKEKPALIINSSLPIFNNAIMEICSESKVNYLDMASYWDFDKNPKAKSPYKIEQFDFNNEFLNKKISGLINAGASPGLTNLLAKECEDLFDNIDSIRIRLYEDTKTSDPYFPWSVEWLLDEINWKPLVYRNGKFMVADNFSGKEEYSFPEHLGKRKVYLAAQDEVGTIPLYMKVKNVDLKMFDSQGDIAKFLMRLGLVSEEKIKIGNCSVSPVEFISLLIKNKQKDFVKMKVPDEAQFAFVIEASGIKNGKKKTAGFYAIFPKQKEINKKGFKANFISYPTAIVAKSFADEILKSKKYGVFPPEALDRETRHRIIKNLQKHVKIRKFERK